MRYLHVILSIIFLVLSNSSYSQDRSGQDDAFAGNVSYDPIFVEQTVFNGRSWKPQFYHVNGSQFIADVDWVDASISVSGHNFDGIRLNYDAVNDEVIAPFRDQGIVIINRELVEGFSFTHNGEEYTFSNIASDNNLIAGYQQVLYRGSSMLSLKWRKRVVYYDVAESYGFRSMNTLLYTFEGKVYRVKGVRDITRLFPEDKKRIRDFIRGLDRRPDINQPSTLVPLCKFLDNIKMT